MKRAASIAAALAAIFLPVALASAAVPGTSCPVFPSNNVWHADITKLPVHPRSSAWLASMSASTTQLHPDFGPSGTSMPYGIPYVVVPGSHAKVSITFDYADESDPGPYPFGSDTPIEGGSDRHAIMVDKDTCTLYELYDAHYSSGGSTAGSGAIWSLKSNKLRPAGWTSADAAGLPILAGLVRLDEVKAGSVDHAIRVTASRTDRSYLWPARHQAGAANDPNLPPMGARFRLKGSYDISHFRADTRAILRAMKKYGLIVADNGSNWFFQGTAENGWSTAMIDELKTVPAGAFVAVDESSLMLYPNSGAVKPPPSPSPSPAGTSAGTNPAASASTNPATIPHPAAKKAASRVPPTSPAASASAAPPIAETILAAAGVQSAGPAAAPWNVAAGVLSALCAAAVIGFLLRRRATKPR